jgi:hypothetical protein
MAKLSLNDGTRYFHRVILKAFKEEHEVKITEEMIDDSYVYTFNFIKKKFFPFKLTFQLTFFKKYIEEIE